MDGYRKTHRFPAGNRCRRDETYPLKPLVDEALLARAFPFEWVCDYQIPPFKTMV